MTDTSIIHRRTLHDDDDNIFLNTEKNHKSVKDSVVSDSCMNITLLEQMLLASKERISLCSIHGVTDELLNDIYAYAYDFYNKGRLEEAESFFKFLCIYDFFNSDYLMGLAAVKQLKKEYKQAIDLYSIAFYNNPADPAPIFYTGQCQLMLQDVEGAKISFSYILGSNATEILKDKSVLFMDIINNIDKTKDDEETIKD